MRVTVDVNGEPIAVVEIVNRGPQTPDGRGWRRYEWRVCHLGSESSIPPVLPRGSVRHRREDGWPMLVERVAREIDSATRGDR